MALLPVSVSLSIPPSVVQEEMCRYYFQPAGLLMDHISGKKNTWIQWLPWELHPQRPRKEGGGGEEVECELKNKRGRGRSSGGRVKDRERERREGGREEGKERRSEAHFSQSKIFDSAERVTLMGRQRRLGFVSHSFPLSFSPPLSGTISLPFFCFYFIISDDDNATFRYIKKCSVAYLFIKSDSTHSFNIHTCRKAAKTHWLIWLLNKENNNECKEDNNAWRK